jgi:putative transposase
VTAHQAVHRIATMCRVLGVSPSGYYAWRQRPLSPRARADVELTAEIQAIHRESRGTYGAPRVHAELGARGVRVGRKRVARLMRGAHVRGVSRRKQFVTTRRDAGAQPAADLVGREFTATGPNRLWVADLTYVATDAGFLLLAVVLDVWSRRVVGWAMAAHLRTELVLDALDMALRTRRPRHVIPHSDHGCQYTSIAFGLRCRQAGVQPSMGSVGDAYDNALSESFFVTLECELLDRHRFGTHAAARLAVFDYIEGWSIWLASSPISSRPCTTAPRTSGRHARRTTISTPISRTRLWRGSRQPGRSRRTGRSCCITRRARAIRRTRRPRAGSRRTVQRQVRPGLGQVPRGSPRATDQAGHRSSRHQARRESRHGAEMGQALRRREEALRPADGGVRDAHRARRLRGRPPGPGT